MAPRLHGGATGTELARRGFDLRAPQWSAAANVAAPELVARIHREYADAGAALVTANTTSVHAHTVGEDVERHCAIAIELARSAGVLVAGSLAMLPKSIDRDARAHQYRRVGDALASADVLLLEGFLDPAELLLALDATRRWAGPRWAALAGPAVARIAEVIAAGPAEVALFCVHCCSLGDADAALTTARTIAPRAALGAYPSPAPDNDDAFASGLGACARAHDLAWIGACCGSTPTTTAAICTALRT